MRNCALGRAIQYSRGAEIHNTCRGALDRPVKPGDDGGVYGGFRADMSSVAAQSDNVEAYSLTLVCIRAIATPSRAS